MQCTWEVMFCDAGALRIIVRLQICSLTFSLVCKCGLKQDIGRTNRGQGHESVLFFYCGFEALGIKIKVVMFFF